MIRFSRKTVPAKTNPFAKAAVLPLTFSGLHTALAQPSGYLGEKFFVQGMLRSSFVLTNPAASDRALSYDATFGGNGGKTPLTLRYGLEAGRAISNKRSLSIGVGYLQTGVIAKTATILPLDTPANADGIEALSRTYSVLFKLSAPH